MARVPSPTSDRRAAILDAAFSTFLRFGYRKTSMEDVAREAEISRQALYAHFTDKEALFRECMTYGLDAAMAAADEALADQEVDIEARLVRAVDEWLGPHVEKRGTDGTDLSEAARAILGNIFADYGGRFEKKVARAIAESRVAAACKEIKATPQEVAQTLCACAKGWKHRAASRAEFVAQIEVAARLLVPKGRK